MKNISLLILLFFAIAFACSKDDPPVPEPSCYISAISEGTDTLCRFFYDNEMCLVKYVHNFNGTSYMRFFEYNEKGLPVRINSYDIDSTRLTRYYTLVYNEKDLLIRKEGYSFSNSFELSGYYNYYYDEQNRLIKTEAASVRDRYPQFDTYEYDEEGNCIKVYKWYHVFTTGEVKLRQYYKYSYNIENSPFSNITLIFDGISGNLGLYKYPIISKSNCIIRIESYIEEDSTEPFQYNIYSFEFNTLKFPIIYNSSSYWGDNIAYNSYTYHYITK